MAAPRLLQQAEVGTHCFHCGDTCDDHPVNFDGHVFCCEGCRLVYGLLKENNLCNYYEISGAPGHAAEDEKKRAAYSSLDDPAVRSKIVKFEDEAISRVTFHIPVMHCSSCIWLLEHLHKLKPGIISSEVNFPRREVTVDFEHEKVKLSEVAALLSSAGYAPAISLGDLELNEKRKRFNPKVLKIGVAGFCFGNIMLLSFPDYLSSGALQELPHLRQFFGWLSLALALPVVLYSASGFFTSAWKAIRFRSLNIDAPIALAVAVTFIRSVAEITTGTGTGYLDSMSGIVFFDELVCPVLQDIKNRQVVCDSEGQVEIRPTVSLIHRKRTDGGSSDNSWVRFCQFEHVITEMVAVVYAEHVDPFVSSF